MKTIKESFEKLNNKIETLRGFVFDIKVNSNSNSNSLNSTAPSSLKKGLQIPTSGDRYFIGIEEEVRRVLITKKGTIPMNPEYGSELYKLRDRPMNDETRLKAISYVFEALDKWVFRVKVKKVDVIANDKTFKLRIEIDPA